MLTIDLGTDLTEETNIASVKSIKLSFEEGIVSSEASKVSVTNIQQTFDCISTSSVRRANLKPESSLEQSSESHTTQSTVKQMIKSQDSDADSDNEISSLHERPKSVESLETSESDINIGQMKRSGTDSSDYELHSTVVLDKQEVTAMKMEYEDDQETFEHKPMPTVKHLQKINSTDLLQRQIKDDMYEQVLSQEDDSVMSESTIETNIFQQKSDPTKTDDKFLDSAISLGRSPSSNDALEGDSLAEYEMSQVQQAEVSEVIEPDWEVISSDPVQQPRSDLQPMAQRSMTPEQALELATEIVQNVQTEALKKYEDLVKANDLPKPQPDSKFTIQTVEKVEEYLKEMEDSEQYDQVEAELIHKVVSKKEEMLKHDGNYQSIDITDDDEHKSETMLNEMKKELRRPSVSVTDEELITDMTSELLQERNIEEIKQHLEATRDKYDKEEQTSSDFKFQTSFRTHFVRDSDTDSNDEDAVEKFDRDPEDIWADDSRVVMRKDMFKERRSDPDSVSGFGSRQKLPDRKSDPEGSSSAGESFFSAPEPVTSGQSRPTSSDVDALLSAVSERSTTTENSEFLTAQDHSASLSSATSHYFTAGSTLSHASVKSSESSGHLASVEVSECSETLVESSLEFEQRQEDGSDTPAGLQQYEDLSSDEVDPSFTMRRATHMRNPSSSSMSFFETISPQEIKCLDEDDVDGNCFSGEKEKYEEEKESLIQDSSGRFPIPDLLASKLSESRETLSSSVITLSNVSEATIIDQSKMMRTSTATLDQFEESVTTMSSSSHSSWSTNVNHSPPKGESCDLMSAQEELDDPDQVFQQPRPVDTEGVPAVQPSLPQEISVDFGSDYDSRPNSELKDVESRPLSTDRMSRTSSTEALHLPINGKRSYSIDDTVSDSLRVVEPFARPKSPMPQHSTESGRNSSDSDEKKLKVCLGPGARSVSPAPGRQSLNSTETYETELAFSQHFTQVFDDTDFEMIKSSQPQPEPDLTPDSMETSQGEEELSQPPGKADHDDLLVGSPPMVSRPLGVKYWPPIDNLDQEYDAVAPMDKRSIARSESDDNSESKFEVDNELTEKDLEDQKKWLENQFDGNQNVEEYSQYGYGQPLDQILEEEEDRYSHSSEDIKELQRFKESLSSTPDFDQIVTKRSHLSRSGEQDDLSMGSLTEFERLEREVGLGSVSGSGSHGSIGSNDSLEVTAQTGDKPKSQLVSKIIHSKSGTGDDVSVDSYSSLKSFELMEQACKEAELIEKKAKQQEEVLSEIEEGHESQESESAETISEFGEDDRSEQDYEDRLFEIDSIIKQAQANVEKFDKDKKPTDEISLKDIMGRPDSRTESVNSGDSLEDQKVPDLPPETSHIVRQSSLPSRIQSASAGASRTTSIASLRSATSTVTQFDPDSMQDREIDLEFEQQDVMNASIDSLDLQRQTDNTMITSTDSLEGSNKKLEMMTSTDSLEGTPRRKNPMTMSTDSIESSTKRDLMTESVDSLEGDQKAPDGATVLLLSTDSIESTSTATRATASMLSSFNSQGSETLVADDEFEHDNSEDSKSLRKLLLDQGNLQIEDSDDSATNSYTSPLMKHKLYHKERDAMVDSIEEVLETEEIDEKGNIIVKKVIQKRTVSKNPKTVRIVENKQNEGYTSDLSEKKDDSCEETIEETDEFGNKKRYIVKRTMRQSDTLGVIEERRQKVGLSPAGELFKSVTEVQSPQSIGRSVTHTEKITRIFDAPSSTPSPPESPPKSTFRSQIPIRKS